MGKAYARERESESKRSLESERSDEREIEIERERRDIAHGFSRGVEYARETHE